MRESVISNLDGVTREIIDALEVWLENKLYGRCPFKKMDYNCERYCYLLFENLGIDICPCYLYGEEATILAFQIICDVWKGYH